MLSAMTLESQTISLPHTVLLLGSIPPSYLCGCGLGTKPTEILAFDKRKELIRMEFK